jgi:8-oxo-dGTP pyrophosphatase MutT (NUDIX family)
MKKWKKVKTIESHDYGGYYKVDRDEVITPGGKKGEYSVVKNNPFAVVIPIDKKGNVYLVRQHRYTTDKIYLELPSGRIEKDEEILVGAKRELEEETALVSGKWKKLGSFDESNGIADNKGNVFIAENVRKIENPRKDPLDKDMFEIEKYSIDEILAMIKENKIDDSPTIVAFSLAFFQGEFEKYEQGKI